MTAVAKLSDAAETVLAVLHEGQDYEPLDARYWSDAIVELLQGGYARLDGTLSRARLIITDAGRAHVAGSAP